MYQSILHCIKKDIRKVEEILGKILKGEKETNDLSKAVQDKVLNLASNWIIEMY